VCLHFTKNPVPNSWHKTNGKTEEKTQMALSTYELQKRELQRELDGYLSRPNLTATERKQCDVLLGKLKDLRSDEERVSKANELAKEFGWPEVKAVSDEQRSKTAEIESFRRYISTGETRGLVSDSGSGAFVVPNAFYNKLLTGVAQYTELMDKDNVNLIETSDWVRPLTIPEIDLSTITSAIAVQGSDTPPVTNPSITSNVLRGYSYRTNPIAATFELEQDSFESIVDILTSAFAVGLARGIGGGLVNGSGTGQPKGVLASATDSGVVSSGGSGSFSTGDLRQLYFSVNRAYRVSPKCAWLMNDVTYQNILGIHDTAGRPLVNITEDSEKLFGKRILISPDMPVTVGTKGLAFGDFGQFQVRVAKNGVLVRRNLEAPGYAEQGASLYTSYMRVDSALNNAATGSIKFATL
jgi:HK97 family phage major capsid protein